MFSERSSLILYNKELGENNFNIFLLCAKQMSRNERKRTFYIVHMYPSKTQISQRIRAVRTGFSLSALRNFHRWVSINAPNEASDQTARMRRPIWIVAGYVFWRCGSNMFTSLMIATPHPYTHFMHLIGWRTNITKTCRFKHNENCTIKKWKFSDKKSWYFSHFCSKHRLWLLVRTASMRRF